MFYSVITIHGELTGLSPSKNLADRPTSTFITSSQILSHILITLELNKNGAKCEEVNQSIQSVFQSLLSSFERLSVHHTLALCDLQPASLNGPITAIYPTGRTTLEVGGKFNSSSQQRRHACWRPASQHRYPLPSYVSPGDSLRH